MRTHVNKQRTTHADTADSQTLKNTDGDPYRRVRQSYTHKHNLWSKKMWRQNFTGLPIVPLFPGGPGIPYRDRDSESQREGEGGEKVREKVRVMKVCLCVCVCVCGKERVTDREREILCNSATQQPRETGQTD